MRLCRATWRKSTYLAEYESMPAIWSSAILARLARIDLTGDGKVDS